MALEFQPAPTAPTPPFSISGTPYYIAMFNAAGDNVVNSPMFTIAEKEVVFIKKPNGSISHVFVTKNTADENSYSIIWNDGNAALGYLDNEYFLKIVDSASSYIFIGVNKTTHEPFLRLQDTPNLKTAVIKNSNGLIINNGVDLKWPEADGTAGQVMKTDGAGVLSFNFPIMILGNIPLTDYTFVGGIFEDLASGANDIYTVPAGKKAAVLEGMKLYNNTGGSVSTYAQIKISGTSYRLFTTVTHGANAGGNVTFNNSLILNEGETYVINTGSTGQSVYLPIIEFDENVPVVRIGSFVLASGDNTVYTVPSGKRAILSTGSQPGANSGGYMRCFNTSGGSVTYTVYSIESGQSKAAKYQMAAAFAVGNNNVSFVDCSPMLRAGDYILVNSTSGSANQSFYGTAIEIDE